MSTGARASLLSRGFLTCKVGLILLTSQDAVRMDGKAFLTTGLPVSFTTSTTKRQGGGQLLFSVCPLSFPHSSGNRILVVFWEKTSS